MGAALLAIACATVATVALAVPADWHRWRSRGAGLATVCATTSPGPGWEHDAGPFLDHLCLQRRRVIRP